MNSERLEQVKSVVVGALMAAAFIIIGPPQGSTPEEAEPALVMVDHSPATDGPYLSQLISE
ncbi:MAG: hypothetical protein AAF184_07365 [Pseudomonadota bacterium]